MNLKIEDKFILQALTAETERNPSDGMEDSIRFLNLPTSSLSIQKLEHIARSFESHISIDPEIKYYAGWAFLDAAYPGLFSLSESPIDSTDSDSIKLANSGFKYFSQLESRAKYLDKNVPIKEMVKRQIPLNDLIFGFKARIVKSFEHILTNPPNGDSPASISNNKNIISKKIAFKLDRIGSQIREQIQIVEKILNFEEGIHSKQSLENIYGNLRGIEAECALLGTVWTAISNNSSAVSYESFALPASVRTDFGLNNEPKGDVIFYHDGLKYAVLITRSKLSSARYGHNNYSSGKTIHFYGDRDLRLPSYVRLNNKIVSSPDFKGYKKESELVMHQLVCTANRLSQ